MYSPLYTSIDIYKNIELTESVALDELVTFLQKLPELRQETAVSFRNIADFPFTSICLLHAKNCNSWHDDPLIESVNLVHITCIKNNQTDFLQVEELAIKIAYFLQWTVEVETDDE